MPEPLTIDEFIDHTLCDVKEPLTSDFISKISHVRSTVHGIDEGLEHDKTVLLKTKKMLKSVVSSGCGYADNVFAFCTHLEKLGQSVLESSEPNSDDIASSLYKFSVVHRDLANMLKHLMQNMNNILIFPIETFMQGDIKSDFRKPFEKALKDYEYKYEKLRKEKLQVMKDTGIFAPETFTTEMIQDLAEERRRVQLETCEYFLKVNELKFKRSTDVLQHLVDLYYSQHHYLRESLSVMEHFGKSMNDLVDRVNQVQRQHDSLKHRLVETREAVRQLCMKESIQSAPTGCSQPYVSSQNYGTKKVGYLLKKSEGKVKRVWQRRRVRIGDGAFYLYHADESKPPVCLPLLTCQLKLLNESMDGTPLAESHSGSTVDNRNCFDLVSNCRTYNFQTEDDHEYEEWICILNNALREEFQRAMNLNGDQNPPSESILLSKLQHNNNIVESCVGESSLGGGESLGGSENDLLESSSPTTHSRDSRLSHVGSIRDGFSTELAAAVVKSSPDSTPGDNGQSMNTVPSRSDIQSALVNRRFGIRHCADCNRPNPDWVSVNLGVLICLECCGVHRELGVHYSRTQSLTMDDLSTGQLLLPHYVGNRLFNRIFESSLSADEKLTQHENASISQRRTFIKSKYIDRIFVTRGATNPIDTEPRGFRRGDHLKQTLLLAVKTSDLSALIQVYAENFDLMTPLQVNKLDEGGSTAPHKSTDHTTALHIAIEQTLSGRPSDRTSHKPCGHGNLPLVEFIIQNSPLTHLQRTNGLGETGLHHAVRHARLDSLKLLLQAGGLPTPLLNATNVSGQTAYQLGVHLLSECHFNDTSMTDCVNLLKLAIEASSTSPTSGSSDNMSASVIASGASGDPYPIPFSSVSGVNPTARADLLRLVNNLGSVEWNLHVDTGLQVVGQPAPIQPSPLAVERNLVSLQRDTVPGWSSHVPKPPCLSTVWGHPDPQTFLLTKSGLATLPRKKGFAPHPPVCSSDDERPAIVPLSHVLLTNTSMCY